MHHESAAWPRPVQRHATLILGSGVGAIERNCWKVVQVIIVAVAAAALGFGLGLASRYLRARRRNVASRGLDSLAILLVAAVMALHHDQAAVAIPYLAAFAFGRFMWPALRVPASTRADEV